MVDTLDGIAEDFGGIAVTRGGRVWFGSSGELRQVASGGRERALEQRNRREALIGVAERAAQAEQEALAAGAATQTGLEEKLADRERADRGLRLADRTFAEAREVERQAAWMIEQRRATPERGRRRSGGPSWRVSWRPSGGRSSGLNGSVWRVSGGWSCCGPRRPVTWR